MHFLYSTREVVEDANSHPARYFSSNAKRRNSPDSGCAEAKSNANRRHVQSTNELHSRTRKMHAYCSAVSKVACGKSDVFLPLNFGSYRTGGTAAFPPYPDNWEEAGQDDKGCPP